MEMAIQGIIHICGLDFACMIFTESFEKKFWSHTARPSFKSGSLRGLFLHVSVPVFGY